MVKSCTVGFNEKNGMMDLNAISSFHPNTSRFNLQDISGSVLLGSWLDLMKINGMVDLNVIRVLHPNTK